MAKRTQAPGSTPKPDKINEKLLELAELLLSDFFFDPDTEQDYKRRLLQHRPEGTAGLVLDIETVELPNGECLLRIEALRSLMQFRVVIEHPRFTASVEGTWSFENEELSRAGFTRTGSAKVISEAVEAMILELDGGDLDDEEFADFLSNLESDEDDDVPLIGDDPREPPDPTALDRSRLKAIAKRLARSADAAISVEDGGWLEQMPQMLPVITDALIGAVSAAKRDAALVTAYQTLLTAQLEFVRYRQDRGWAWADDMLQDYQQQLVEIGQAETIPRDDWFMMCTALSDARVPVTEAVQTALAGAGFKADDLNVPPEEMMGTLRLFMDELARMVTSPFEVVEALKGSGALLPAPLRIFMATELALSPHLTLRDAVPLLLLDEDSAVRTAAAGALEQTARPETLSPDALRRAIAVRNWIPAADRPPLDAAIRKARLARVETGAWPPASRDVELYASSLDGSGAQSILAASRAGKKGLFAGLLLRHGTGVVDAWANQDVSRGKIGKLLREAQMSAPSVRVDKAYVDSMVQHAIAASVDRDGVPPASLLEIAEILGSTEWKDRRIDIGAAAQYRFEALDPADRTVAGIASGFERGLEWLADDEIFGTWFEDGPLVLDALAKVPRTDRAALTAVVMTSILPPRRREWAERFLIMALWCEAAGEPAQRTRTRDLVLVAHALAGDAPLEAIPVMRVIAAQTVQASLLGGW